MRKLLTFVIGTIISCNIFAGGLVTNNNQSAMFTRLQNRNASTGIDAVFFNPAGLTKLGDGLFFSINNQTIGQTKTVGNNYSILTDAPREYVGKVSAPIYPGAYVVYNTGKLSFSAGFNPIGGGGGAKYDNGLPSFESQIAELVPLLTGKGFTTTKYSGEIFFEGSSVYFGYQANAAYKVNDKISVAFGGRLVSAKNAYKGYMRKISVNPNYPAFGANFNGTNMVLATDFFTAGAATLNSLASGATAFVAGLQPIINGGAGATPLANGTSVGLSATQVTQIQQILGAAGLTPAQIAAQTISSAQGTLSVAAPGFTANANSMNGYKAKTSDINVDAEQTGMAFTPILSANFSPAKNLNIAVKYEFQTKLNLKTNVIDGKNGGGIYIQDSVSIADLPAILFTGVEFRPSEKLMLSGTFNCYFDKKVDYDGQDDVILNKINNNFLEYGLGAEYSINNKLRVSAGWLATSTGVNSDYQSDLTYSTNTNSVGAGFGYRINDKIDLNIGGQYTFYKEGSKTFTRLSSITETYNKKTWIIGVGLDFSFGKTKAE
jgi:long-chain fatty acid transport protein